MNAVIEYRVTGIVGSITVHGVISKDQLCFFRVVDDLAIAFLNPAPENYGEYLEDFGVFERVLTFEEALDELIISEKVRKEIEADPEIHRQLEEAKRKISEWFQRNQALVESWTAKRTA